MFWVWGMPSLAGASEPELVTAVLAEMPFRESYNEDVGVSGAVVVGVAASTAMSGSATLAGLRIPVVPDDVDHICLTLLSRDGVYFARNTYKVPDPAPKGSEIPSSLVLLPVSKATKHPDIIPDFKLGDLAVRTTAGDCTDERASHLVASDRSEFESVDLLINAFGANAVYYRTTDGTTADCVEFSEGRRTSYDYRCTVPIAALRQSNGAVTVERERYGRPLGEVEIKLILDATP
jgi:hypothetical protein